MTSPNPHADQRNGRSSSAATEGRERIRVVLADDHPAVRVGMRRLIDDQPDMLVVLEARGAEEALGDRGRSEDVVVLDYHLGGSRDGLWMTRQLKRRPGPPRVLIYSAFAGSPLTPAALVAGADGLLSTTSLGDELCHVIRELFNGRRYLPAVPEALAQALSAQLRPDDRAILSMLLADVEPDEIAQRLRLSPRQLDDQRGRMLLALTHAAHAAGQSHASLDYDRARRHAHYTVS